MYLASDMDASKAIKPVPAKKKKDKDSECWACPPDTNYDTKGFRLWCALHQGGKYCMCRRCGYWLNEDMLPRVTRLSIFRDKKNIPRWSA